MGFLASLFSGNSKEALTEKLEQEETAGELPKGFPKLHNGMPVDVITKDKNPLLSGRITSFSASSMTIERLIGGLAFDTCAIASIVTVRGYDDKLMQFNLKAVVEESSRIICRLKDVEVQPYNEHRNNFRLPVNSPISLYYMEDRYLENPEECMLVDISTGGACVQSEFMHAEDEVLRMKIQIEEYAPMTVVGQIIRAYEHSPGLFRYGILFAQLKEEEITSLTKMLYNIQMGNRKEWRRGEGGYWE